MKKKTLPVFVSITVLLLLWGSTFILVSKPTVPPVAKTGAPMPGGDSEGTCADSYCHAGAVSVNHSVLSLDYNNGNPGYVPGETYDLILTLNQGTSFGFQMVALGPDDNASKGNFIISDNTSTEISKGPHSREYMSHKNASSQNSWSFKWKAPDTDVGPITFYYIGNAANDDGTSSGDKIYRSFKEISAVTGLVNRTSGPAVFGPNPAREWVQGPHQITEWQWLDLSGKVIVSGVFPGNGSTRVATPVQMGTYVFRARSVEGSEFQQRILVLP